MKLRWCCARDLFWIANSSDHKSKVLWPSGLGNYLVCKKFAVQTLLRSLEFVAQNNLEHDTITIWGISIKIETYWSDTVWCYLLNIILVTLFFLLSLFHSSVYYLRSTFKKCSFPITRIAKKKVTQEAGKTFFYLIQTKYYFLFQMLPSPWLQCKS